MKKYLTSICFFLIAIVQVVGIQLQWGMVSWLTSLVLLLLAAYFTKYLKPTQNVKEILSFMRKGAIQYQRDKKNNSKSS